jgi:hypothetical protein
MMCLVKIDLTGLLLDHESDGLLSLVVSVKGS